MSTTRFLTLLIALTGLGLLEATPLEAQRARAFYLTTSSDHNREIDDGTGFGLGLGIPIPVGIEVRLGWRRASDESITNETVCTTYLPTPTNCAIEDIRTETSLTHFSVGLGWPIELLPMVSITPAGEAVLSKISFSPSSDSGRAPNWFFPNSGQFGGLLTLEVIVTPVPALPLIFSAAASRRWIRYSGCSTSEQIIYAPFCGTGAVTEFEIGAGFWLR